MRFFDWSDSWPLLALRWGAIAGAFGMVAAQIAQGAPLGQVIFTLVFALAFAVAVQLFVRGNAIRLARPEEQRTPEKEPLKMVLVALMTLAIIMWLLGGYGVFIAMITTRPENKWLALAYLGVAVCATGATALFRQARLEWVARYLSGWPSED